jgi:hypothetical protein
MDFNPTASLWAITNNDNDIIMVDDNYDMVMFTTFIFQHLLYKVVKLPTSHIQNDRATLLKLVNNRITVARKLPKDDLLALQQKLIFIRLVVGNLIEFTDNAKKNYDANIFDEMERLRVTKEYFSIITPNNNDGLDIVTADIEALQSDKTAIDNYKTQVFNILRKLDYTADMPKIKLEFREMLELNKHNHTHSIHQWFDDAIIAIL